MAFFYNNEVKLFILFFPFLLWSQEAVHQAALNWKELQNQSAKAVQKEDFKLAQELIVKAMELQPKNEVLYYNLGYTFYQQNDLAKALAYLRKASSLRPSFSEALDLKSEIEKQLDQELLYTGAWHRFFHYIPIHLLYFLSLSSFFISIWSLLTWFAKKKRAENDEFSKKPEFSWHLVALFVLFVFFTGSASVGLYLNSMQRASLLENAELRIFPDDDSAVLQELPKGSLIRVLQRRDAWIQIEGPRHNKGWVDRSQVLVL